MDCDVVVVGAGLAGLQCARTLGERGATVTVLEAGDGVGGRVRSETVDGYTLDRGFQQLNPAYPAVRAHVDVDALDLQRFAPGVAVRRDTGLALLADPHRAPRLLPRTLASGYVRPRELVALARWAGPALGPVGHLLRAEDTSLARSWDGAGLRGRLRHDVLEPFLAGVLAEDDGSTSAQFVRLLVRSFVLGTPGVPAAGMGAWPAQLATHVADIALGTPAERIEGSDGTYRVQTPGGPVTSRAVVVATDPVTAEALTAMTAPTMKGLVTTWYASDEPPSTAALVHVDGRRRGPVVNTAVMSAVAPSYAPPGSHLVQVTCLLRDRPPDDATVRRHAGEIYGVDAGAWQDIARHVIPHALPAQPPPLAVRRPVDLGGGLFVCGDHRDTASSQGALVSGRRTAEAVRRWLHG